MFQLAAELANPSDWRAYAACADYSTEWWFPSKGHAPDFALAVCQGCPVAQACLDERMAAITSVAYDDGVWGGTTPRQRLDMRMGRMPAVANPPQGQRQEAA